jgi:hypothetical protein
VPRHTWTAEDIERLRRFYPDGDNAELCWVFGVTLTALYGAARKFGVGKSEEFLERKRQEEARRLRVSGKSHRFQKGSVPANKGLRRPGWATGRMRETQFKKGQRPPKWRPPGSTRIDTEGYVLVKVAETGLFQWRFLHQDVWRLHHGRQPKGMCVAFKDGNKLNCEYSNLELITQAENMLRNSIHKYPRAIVPVMAALSKLNREIRNYGTKEQVG